MCRQEESSLVLSLGMQVEADDEERKIEEER